MGQNLRAPDLEMNRFLYVRDVNPRSFLLSLGVKDYKKEWSLGELKGNFLYFSRSKYSLWTSRAFMVLTHGQTEEAIWST